MTQTTETPSTNIPDPLTPPATPQGSPAAVGSATETCPYAEPEQDVLEVEFWHCRNQKEIDDGEDALDALPPRKSLWHKKSAVSSYLLSEAKEEHYLDVEYDDPDRDTNNSLVKDRAGNRVRGVVGFRKNGKQKRVKVQLVDENGKPFPADKNLECKELTLSKGEYQTVSFALNPEDGLIYRLQAEEIDPQKEKKSLIALSRGSIQAIDLDGEVEFLHATTLEESANQESLIKALPKGTLIHDDDSVKTAILTQPAKHYVNLPRENKFLDTSTEPGEKHTHVDRTTQKPRIIVRFKNKYARDISVSIINDTANISYSAREKNDNTNFTDDVTKLHVTDDCGIAIIDDCKINAAGGNKYTITATDTKTGKKISSTGIIEVWRYFWLQILKYKHLTNNIVADDIAKEYESVFIKINTTEFSEIQNNDIEVRYNNTPPPYWGRVNQLFNNARRYSPYAIPLILSRLCTDVVDRTISASVTFAKNQINNLTLYPYIYSENLFNTSTNDWIISATFTSQDRKFIDLHIENALSAKIYTQYSHLANAIAIDTRRLPQNIFSGAGSPSAQGSIRITCKSTTNSVPYGVSNRVTNICAISMEMPDNTRPALRIRQRCQNPNDPGPLSTCTHEIGHHMNMVTSGLAPFPDHTGNYTMCRHHGQGAHCVPSSFQYVCKTHKTDPLLRGSACPYYNSTPATTPRQPIECNPSGYLCVMYGKGSYDRSTTFCSDCVSELRKMDLSQGKPI